MNQIEEVNRAPVSHALLFVCEKCGKHEAKSLQKAVKRESKRQGDKRSVRAVLTGCLGVCPDDAITVAIASLNEPARFILVSEDALEKDDFESAAKELVSSVTR